MEVRSMRLDHGPIQTNNMSYPQRQPQNHRPNHSSQSTTVHVSAAELYKSSRSPLSNTRCSYPPTSQLQPNSPNIAQVQVSQRYPAQGQAASITTPAASSLLTPATAYHRPQLDYRHTNRISLLHPEYGPGGRREAAGGGAGGQPPPNSSADQPLKKIRLSEEMQPLRIDTRPGAYNPKVEAVSPTFPEPISQEDQVFKTTKDRLIQQISKVDREILKAEQQIVILKKKQAELEEVANKPTVSKEVEEDAVPKNQSLPQKIYAENRKRAQSAHALLDCLGPKVEWPLYNQPTDTTVFHENNRRNVMFKKRLLEYFKKKHAERHARNNHLAATYSKLMQEWIRKCDKIESSTKRKVKEAKNREFFEKTFPEVKRQRENKERFNRVGSRVKSEVEMDEFSEQQEQDNADRRMRSYAVIPPILLDPKERRIKYTNNNNFVEDMEEVYQSRQYLNIWTAQEKETFKEKYLQHPKNFYQISQALGEKKSVSECVRFYYLSKKTENYKRLLRKNRRDKLREKLRQSRNSGKINNNANLSVVDNLSTGVTTRLQREQQQRTEGSARSSEASTSAVTAVSAEVGSGTATSSPPPPALGTTAAPSPLNVGATTTTSTTAPSSTSTANVSSSEWTGATITSTAQIPVSVSQSVTTSSTTISSSVASTSPCPSPMSSSICLTTTSTTTTSAILPSTSHEVSNPENDSSKDSQGVKFSDFNSFEDFNNRKNNFGDTSTGGTITATEEKGNEFATGEQNEKENTQDKRDGESTSTTSENVCDPRASSTTPTPESKKKKERRKENTNMESSDDEAASMQDKNIQGNCAVCNAPLGPQLHSRPLQPSQAAQYGLREEQVPLNSRVCNTCRCKCVRSRYTHCPLSNCPNGRGRVKRLRSFPYRLQDLPSDVRDPILAEFRIPSGVTKCCSACFIRIQRRLGPVEEWPDEEVNQLKGALNELGANWQLIGERLNKLGFQVRSFYAANRKRLNLEACLGDRKPTLTDEEESGSSTSSCEEPMRERERHSSDTTSAAESPPVLQGGSQNAIKKEDYDSSATETADEAQTDHYQAATITPVCNDYQSRPAESPLSVKELMMDMIERSLNKAGGQQPGPVQGPGMTPTISSILNNDANEVTIVSEYNLNSIPNRSQPPHQSRTDISITKLANTIGATITPVTGPIRSQPEPIQSSRDDLVVVQVPDNREPISETLDLSIKKPREPMPPTHPKHIQSSMHRSDAYMYHPERKSPFVRTSQVKLPTPQPANPKTGSITLGTPIINQPTRYDALLRQTSDKMGSITKGTPIHPSHSVPQDKRMFEYYPKQGRMPSQPSMAQQPQYQYAAQRTSYDQQISSQRKLIFDDYMTSQQMQNRRPEKPQYYSSNSSHRTPPPQQSQQRQGVIQRHTRPQYHPTPPGHEALSTLVELSVQQPSLPVPNAPHEGLGKTMADNIMEQPHRLQLLQHQQQMRQQQQRIEEQRRVAYHQQQQQQHQQQQHQQQQQQQQQARQQGRADPSTMTAASLIDAIITHQINQTAETGRGDVVPNSREPPRAGDLLFQGFQRDPPVSQDNGLRTSSIINVDLDNEVVNKNLTVKELTDSVISHDFSTRPSAYYHMQETEQWKRRLQAQQQQKEENKRSATPQQSSQQQQQDERQIIRIAQPQKYHHEPLSPPDNNHWAEQNYRRYQQPPSHMSPLDYVKNRIVEVMRTEDDKKDTQEAHPQDKDRSVSPGDMVIDEEKHENDFGGQQQSDAQHLQARSTHQQPPSAGYSYSYVHKDPSNDSRSNEPKPLLSAQYEPLSDED